jgi:hypothetical protein
VQVNHELDWRRLKSHAGARLRRVALPSAEIFGEHILSVMHSRGKSMGSSDVSTFIEQYFADDIEEHGQRMRELIEGRQASVAEDTLWDVPEGTSDAAGRMPDEISGVDEISVSASSEEPPGEATRISLIRSRGANPHADVEREEALRAGRCGGRHSAAGRSRRAGAGRCRRGAAQCGTRRRGAAPRARRRPGRPGRAGTLGDAGQGGGDPVGAPAPDHRRYRRPPAGLRAGRRPHRPAVDSGSIRRWPPPQKTIMLLDLGPAQPARPPPAASPPGPVTAPQFARSRRRPRRRRRRRRHGAHHAG